MLLICHSVVIKPRVPSMHSVHAQLDLLSLALNTLDIDKTADKTQTGKVVRPLLFPDNDRC